MRSNYELTDRDCRLRREIAHKLVRHPEFLDIRDMNWRAGVPRRRRAALFALKLIGWCLYALLIGWMLGGVLASL